MSLVDRLFVLYAFLSLVLLTLVPPSDPLDLSHRPWLWQGVSMVDRLLVLLERILLVLHCPVLSESCSSLLPLDLFHRPWLFQRVSADGVLFVLLEHLLLVLH